jgi:hypothetical protein
LSQKPEESPSSFGENGVMYANYGYPSDAIECASSQNEQSRADSQIDAILSIDANECAEPTKRVFNHA